MKVSKFFELKRNKYGEVRKHEITANSLKVEVGNILNKAKEGMEISSEEIEKITNEYIDDVQTQGTLVHSALEILKNVRKGEQIERLVDLGFPAEKALLLSKRVRELRETKRKIFFQKAKEKILTLVGIASMAAPVFGLFSGNTELLMTSTLAGLPLSVLSLGKGAGAGEKAFKLEKIKRDIINEIHREIAAHKIQKQENNREGVK